MFRRILLAVDLADEAETPKRLARGVGAGEPRAAAIFAWSTCSRCCRRRSWNMSRPISTPSRSAARSEALQAIAAKIALPPERVSIAAASGGVYHELLREATDWGADLIVVGSHRPVMSDYLLGSNAKTIVRHAECSVLVVRV